MLASVGAGKGRQAAVIVESCQEVKHAAVAHVMRDGRPFILTASWTTQVLSDRLTQLVGLTD